MYGDLSGVHKLEARFAEVFPNGEWPTSRADEDSPLKRFAQRFTYNGLDQIALRDLGFGARQAPPSPLVKRPLPESPRLASPIKRQRAGSPQRPPQKFRDRTPRSPPRREPNMPPVHVPTHASVNAPTQAPIHTAVHAPVHAPLTYGAYRPLIHFIGSLPSARSFDGES